MRCSRKILLLSLAIALPALACAADKKEKSKDKEAQKAPATSSKKKEKGEESDDKPLPKLSLPLPKGQDSKGVTIPYTDGSGKKTMIFRIGVGTRLDDENVKMADLKIETFDDAGEQEMTIELPSSKMNLNTRIIAGDQSVTIKRSDFQLTGQTMEFNTETKQGWIKGNVKMIIYDLTETAEQPAGKKGGQGS